MSKPKSKYNPHAADMPVAGAATIVLCWVVGLVGLDVPGEVGGALTVLLASLPALLPHRRGA